MLVRSAVVTAAALALTGAVGALDIAKGEIDLAPPGFEQYVSPIVVPSPSVAGEDGWASAVQKAREFVSQLTLPELVNLTTGAGTTGRCTGNTGEIPRLGFKGFCLNDGPIGVRQTDLTSVFPAGINAAATWDKKLIEQRAIALGEEFRGKGVNIALAPMMNLARVPAAGRNWEGFGADIGRAHV